MKRLLSFLFPITRKVPSPVSGTLEVTWYAGKKVLDSEHANYSFGSLQRILKFGLEQMPLDGVRSVLLLGMGGGSVIETLRKDFAYAHSIVAVDLDPVVIEIAAKEFGITPDEHLRVVCRDAADFVFDCSDRFDLILVDLFIDNKIPQKFYDLKFWEQLVSLVSVQGNLLFNTMENTSGDLEKIKSLLSTNNFELVRNNRVEMLNRVFIWQKK
jgi:hypothetical protein